MMRNVIDARAIAAVIAMAVVTGCSETDAPSIPPAAVTKVEIAEARTLSIPIVMEFPGTVESVRAVQIVPQVSGTVTERNFAEGTYVEQDASLYVIDPRPFEAQLEVAKAQLQENAANVKFWQSELSRTEKLLPSGAGSRQERDKAQAQLSFYQAAVLKAQAEIESARLAVEYAHIKAPFPGYVEATSSYVGSQVVAWQTVMTTLVQTDPVHVIFNISRAQLAAIQRLQVKGSGFARLAGFEARARLGDGRLFAQTGTVDYVSSQVDPHTDTLIARAVLPNPQGGAADVRLIAGQYVAILITVSRQSEALLIPKAALVETQAGRYVYVVDGSDRVKRRAVEIDRAHQDNWVVSKGVEAGDKVVVSGLPNIRPGAQVQIVSGAVEMAAPSK